MAAINLDSSVLSTLPKRTRTRKPPKFAAEIEEAIAGFKANPDSLFGIEVTAEKQNATRQSLYTAAKAAGVKIRTYWLGDAEKPQDVVAYRVTSLTLDTPEEGTPAEGSDTVTK